VLALLVDCKEEAAPLFVHNIDDQMIEIGKLFSFLSCHTIQLGFGNH
jgi:hypothetical protein